MANRSTPHSPTHSGWFNNDVDGTLDLYEAGTKVMAVSSALVAITGALTTSTTATITGNLTISSTLTAGADGVGSDGEQLTSGGAAAECDWAAAASLKKFKNLLGLREDADEVLEQIVNTPVYDFKYKKKDESDERIMSTGDTETVYTGIMAEDAPWAMHFKNRILNPINTFGYMVLAIRALENRVRELEGATA